MPRKTAALPVSEHFELKPLAEGVYAAMAIPGGAAFSNAGIVDLGDQTLVFDTFETPQAARDLKAAAEQLAGRPVTYVLISHSHADHWCGNQVFGSRVPIIAARASRAEMPADVAWLEELKAEPGQVEQELQVYRDQLAKTADPRQRAALEAVIARMGHWLDMFPTLAFRLPDLTFDGKLTFHGARRVVEARAVAPGHTACDVYLHLPQDRITFLGDLGFFQSQPFMVFCDPGAWVACLEEMERAEVDTFVPGHGPLGTKADLALQRQYITLLEERIAGAVQSGQPVEEVLAMSLPAPFDGWQRDSAARWEGNVRALYDRLVEGRA